jgi:hypothetical protein
MPVLCTARRWLTAKSAPRDDAHAFGSQGSEHGSVVHALVIRSHSGARSRSDRTTSLTSLSVPGLDPGIVAGIHVFLA